MCKLKKVGNQKVKHTFGCIFFFLLLILTCSSSTPSEVYRRRDLNNPLNWVQMGLPPPPPPVCIYTAPDAKRKTTVDCVCDAVSVCDVGPGCKPPGASRNSLSRLSPCKKKQTKKRRASHFSGHLPYSCVHFRGAHIWALYWIYTVFLFGGAEASWQPFFMVLMMKGLAAGFSELWSSHHLPYDSKGMSVCWLPDVC